MNTFARSLERSWYRPGSAWTLLKPLAYLYGAVVAMRRLAYRRGWLTHTQAGVPVLVIGNITVGGSGKTPLTLALIEKLQTRGLRVGVVSRGYGGRAPRYPFLVTHDTATTAAGDEPVLIAQRSGAVVAVDPVRVRAARWLVEHAGVDIILADDGLQHYALARDAEIAVTDARRGLGNGWLLPAGPLREPASRLMDVNLALTHGAARDFWFVPGDAISLAGTNRRPLADFCGAPVHAVAGIGDPARFFDMLGESGLGVIAHPMPDHHGFTAADIDFAGESIFMTEKDAVKCRDLADSRHWYVPVTLRFAADCERRIDALLDRLCRAATNNGRMVE